MGAALEQKKGGEKSQGVNTKHHQHSSFDSELCNFDYNKANTLVGSPADQEFAGSFSDLLPELAST